MKSIEADGQKVFSIIVAVYNCGQKIEQTLASILGQNKDLFELIVIDGASTDDTLDYVKKHENRLTLISEKDAGVYDAFNKGIDRATGKYLYFIGAGDKLREGILEIVASSLPSAAPAVVYGDAYVVRDDYYHGGEYCQSRIKRENICHQALFYHRDVFQIIGKYDLRYKIFADWALNLQCFGSGGIAKKYLPYLITDFEGGGLSSIKEDAEFTRDFPLLIRNYLGKKHYVVYKYPAVYRTLYLPIIKPFISRIRKMKKVRRNA